MKALLIFALCLARLAGGLLYFEPREEPVTVLPTEEISYEEPSFDKNLQLLVAHEGTVLELSLQEYLVGVVLAEMSPKFPQEALKAQAVAARTFALKKARSDRHPQAHVCTDAACCQGWIEPRDVPGSEAARQAVETTDGLVLYYEEELIDATYFSCSGGRTEAAVAVWGEDIPYLRSVESPGEEQAPRYEETICIGKDDFREKVLASYPEANLSGSPQGWFGAVSYTAGGGIDSIFVGGTVLQGTELRRLFGLRSTDISIETSQTQIYLTTHGFGHRVGMSQYGAKAMAEKGVNFASILEHYYGQTELRRLIQEANGMNKPVFLQENQKATP